MDSDDCNACNSIPRHLEIHINVLEYGKGACVHVIQVKTQPGILTEETEGTWIA